MKELINISLELEDAEIAYTNLYGLSQSELIDYSKHNIVLCTIDGETDLTIESDYLYPFKISISLLGNKYISSLESDHEIFEINNFFDDITKYILGDMYKELVNL